MTASFFQNPYEKPLHKILHVRKVLEIIVWIILLLVLLAVVSAYSNFRYQPMVDAANLQLSSINRAIECYQRVVGDVPNRLQDLIVRPAGLTHKEWKGPYLEGKEIPHDPWRNPFRLELIECDGSRFIRITSAGPDGVSETDDDIRSEELDVSG